MADDPDEVSEPPEEDVQRPDWLLFTLLVWDLTQIISYILSTIGIKFLEALARYMHHLTDHSLG